MNSAHRALMLFVMIVLQIGNHLAYHIFCYADWRSVTEDTHAALIASASTFSLWRLFASHLKSFEKLKNIHMHFTSRAAGGVRREENLLCRRCANSDRALNRVCLRQCKSTSLFIQLSVECAFVNSDFKCERRDRMSACFNSISEFVNVYQSTSSFQTRISASYMYIILAILLVVNGSNSHFCELFYTKVLHFCESCDIMTTRGDY